MIQFTKPLYLLLLIPAGYYTWWLSGRSLSDMSRLRSRLALGLRMTILIMLVMSLAGARMVRNVSQQCVVFLMDVSDSIPRDRQDSALAHINRALKTMKKHQKAGLVVFGGEASVELTPGNFSKVEKVYSVPSTSHTDISQALGLALASFPEQCQKKIVLLSDGNETMGKALEQAMLAGSDNVSIDTVPISGELGSEALLDRMVCPNLIKIGEPFDLKVVAVSKQPAPARIRILRNGAPAGEKYVDLAKGKNVFTFQQSIAKAGSYGYEAILECDQDTRPENNVASAYTLVKGKPRVLYVEGQPGQGSYLKDALSASNIEVDLRDRSGIPNTLADLRGCDMLVLSDVPAWNLAPEQMAMVKSAVKDLGMGFTMVGGELSFGAGGYFDTPIEEALPVDMSVRKTKVMPSLSVVIVMDKSGSMGMVENGREKIQLANDAAAAVVKLLQPIDKVAVVVCHSFPVTAVPLRPASSKGPIYSQIATIRAEGGGIMVHQSMQMAYKIISGASTRQRHIILLADGSDCDEQGGVVALTQKMAREKITVTTVAFGDGPHVPFLKAVAYAGKGYYYLARRGSDLKAIFTKDVMAVSKALVVEEPFTPRMDTTSPELSGIDASSAPPLLGYVTTSAKPAASVSVKSHRDDPILATWQCGLGRSAAFTSDCKARWSARWLTWNDYSKFWAQVVRSTMRKSAPGDFQTTVEVSGGVGRVVIDAVDEAGGFVNFLEFAGSVVGPDMRAHPIVIDQTGPGRYESSFDARDVGNYVVNVAKKGQGAPEVNVVSIPYPPEYKDIAPNTALLRQLSSQTSGRFAPDPARIFAGDFRKTKSYADLWQMLALLAILLLPVDVAVRRMAVNPRQVAEILGAALEPVRRRRSKARERKAAQPDRSEVVTSLLRVKKDLPDPARQPQRIDVPAPPGPAPKAPEPEPPAKPEPKPPATGEVTSRLLEAKKRAREKKE